jgi:transposase
VKNVPGRKTDLADAEWLAQLPGVRAAGRQLHPPGGGQGGPRPDPVPGQDLPAAGAEIARLGDVLQDAGIKTGLGGLVHRDEVRAGDDRGADRRGAPRRGAGGPGQGQDAEQDPGPAGGALEGRFGEHHAMLCRLHLDHIDHLEAMMARLDAQVEAMMQPFHAARDLLVTIPGIGPLSAAAVIPGIGPAPREYFPAAGHLASWAGLCPGNHEPAGKRHSGRRRHGNTYLQPVLAVIAWAAIRHPGYLKSPCRRHVMRNGGYRSKTAQAKAIVTVAHAVLVIIWHVLATGKPYDDLGADYFDRRTDPDREAQRLIARPQALGHHVTLHDAA